MKKIILMLMIAAVAVSSCKKESKNSRENKPIGDGILGVWYTTSETHDYYNANNEKIFTKTVEPGWKYNITDILRIYDLTGKKTLQTNYEVSNSNNKNYFNFTNNGVEESYDITSLEQETMAWRTEKLNVRYDDNGQKTAAKEIITLEFRCPCR